LLPVDSPSKGGPKVVVFTFAAIEPLRLVLGFDLRLGRLGQPDEPFGMPPSHGF
jgi:hypothetical protein